MKRTSKLVMILAGAAAVLAPLAPQASAADSAVVVFTAGATVGHDIFAPGLGPDVASSTYVFDTAKNGLGGQKACVAVHSSKGADPSCDLRSTGTFGAAFGINASCAWSRGAGDVVTINVNGTNVVPYAGTTPNLKVTWPVSSGTVLPLILTTGSTYPGGTVIGGGAVQVTGAKPGTCGVGGPTREFEVTGFAAGSF